MIKVEELVVLAGKYREKKIRCLHVTDTKYSVHPDFAKLPSLTLTFGRFSTLVINAVIACMRMYQLPFWWCRARRYTIKSTDESTFNIFVFAPENLPAKAPALIYYHGGAFALTYTREHLHYALRYAREANCYVIFPDYRLGPVDPFPHGFNDCYATLLWVRENAERLGIDPQRIAVGGDSAGGALAASVSQKNRDKGDIRLCGQMLVYPVADYECRTQSAREFGDTLQWDSRSNANMWKMYLRDFKGVVPAYASPVHGDLHALPPAYVETAEYDPLHDEGIHYAHALQDHGCEVNINETFGTVHGFDHVKDSAITRAAVDARIGFLKQIFA